MGCNHQPKKKLLAVFVVEGPKLDAILEGSPNTPVDLPSVEASFVWETRQKHGGWTKQPGGNTRKAAVQCASWQLEMGIPMHFNL